MSGEPTFTMTFTEDEMYNIALVLSYAWLDEPVEAGNREAYELAKQFERVRMGKPQRVRRGEDV